MESKVKVGLLSAAVMLGLSGCSSLSPMEKTAALANLDIKYKLETNFAAQEGVNCQELGADWASCSKVVMKITNPGPKISGDDWKLYLHSIRVILDVANKDFNIRHVTGDLYELTPTSTFKAFNAGETVEIPMIAEYWTLFETDFMPRAYVVVGEGKPQAVKSLDTEDTSSYIEMGANWKRTPDDKNVLATASSRFEKNKDVALLEQKYLRTAIIPTPLRTKPLNGDLDISAGFKLSNHSLDGTQLAAFTARAERLGLNLKGKTQLRIKHDPKKFKGKEAVSGAYQLAIGQGGVDIIGYDSVGAFYGLQSLLALTKTGQNHIPMLSIEDAPRYNYRGVMVDVARNFHSKEAILRTIEQMAAYKMNKLHMHLSDDEAWRLEIPALPELTEVGANRCHDLSETSCLLPQLGSGPDKNNDGTGFFSRADYIEILKFAKARGIEVIPEFDMPAHARAAVMSMEARYRKYSALGDMAKANEYRLTDPNDTSNITTVQFYNKQSFINPCMDSSQRFVDKLIAEVKAMHDEAGLPLTAWHFGGDEAKNIRLGGGYQDPKTEEVVAWKGNIDKSVEDKPLSKSPICQSLVASGKVKGFDELPSHFAEQVSKMVAKHGIASFQAWQDGLKHSKDAKSFATANVQVNFWDVLYWGGTATGNEWANKGYNVILSNPDYLYMDMPYEVDPKERGYYWATRATDTRKMFAFAPDNLPQNAETSLDRDGNGFEGKSEHPAKRPFHGLSAQLWSETVRTDEQYEYMVFPRVLAAAERAWHKGDWEVNYKPNVVYSQKTTHVNKAKLNADWKRFANLLGQRELAKIDATGVQYRVPLPGAVVKNNLLHMNVSLPGLPLQYSQDAGQTWQDWTAPTVIDATKKTWIRALSADKKRASRVSEI
ncbi:MAG: beta-N-acetylhexosaminidase [Enterovibrio sp.]